MPQSFDITQIKCKQAIKSSTFIERRPETFKSFEDLKIFGTKAQYLEPFPEVYKTDWIHELPY